MSFFAKRPWAHKPVTLPEIDWSDPLWRDLKFFGFPLPDGRIIDLVSGDIGEVTAGGVNAQVTANGIASSVSANTRVFFPNVNHSVGTGPATLACGFTWDGRSGDWQTAIALDGSQLGIYVPKRSRELYLSADSTQAGAINFTGASVVANEFATYACSSTGSPGYTFRGYKNGQYVGAGSNSLQYNEGVSGVQLFSGQGGEYGKGAGLFWLVFSRELSDSEHRQIDSLRIWSHLKPRTVFISTEVSGQVNVGLVDLVFTQNKASVSLDSNVTASSASLNLSLNEASVALDKNIAVASPSLALTPIAASVSLTRDIYVDTASLTLTQNQAIVSSATDVNINVKAVVLSFLNNTASISYSRDIKATSVSLNLAQQQAEVAVDKYIQVNKAGLNLLSNAASILFNKGIKAGVQTLNLTAHATNVLTGVDTYVNVGSSALIIQEYPTTIDYSREVQALFNALTLTPLVANVGLGLNIEVSGPVSLNIAPQNTTVSGDAITEVNAGYSALSLTVFPAKVYRDVNIYVNSAPRLNYIIHQATASLTTSSIPTTLDSDLDIHLGNVPQIDDPQVYEAVLNVHSALEAVLDYLQTK